MGKRKKGRARGRGGMGGQGGGGQGGGGGGGNGPMNGGIAVMGRGATTTITTTIKTRAAASLMSKGTPVLTMASRA